MSVLCDLGSRGHSSGLRRSCVVADVVRLARTLRDLVAISLQYSRVRDLENWGQTELPGLRPGA